MRSSVALRGVPDLAAGPGRRDASPAGKGAKPGGDEHMRLLLGLEERDGAFRCEQTGALLRAANASTTGATATRGKPCVPAAPDPADGDDPDSIRRRVLFQVQRLMLEARPYDSIEFFHVQRELMNYLGLAAEACPRADAGRSKRQGFWQWLRGRLLRGRGDGDGCRTQPAAPLTHVP